MILVDNPGSDDKAYWAIKHAEWNGWSPADFIFPSFLFLVGVSMVFSFSARLHRGESRGQILFHAFKRSLILIAVGLFVNGFPFIGTDWHSFRFEGVTQRIALCYFAAAILVLWSNRRGQLIAIAACLLGYWAMLRFLPVPGFGLPGRDIPFMDQNGNIVAWLDRKLFMGHLYNGNRDPEGIISTIPAVATTLIGVLTGWWLRSGRSRGVIALRMLLFGILGLVVGEDLERLVPHQQESLDQLVHALQRWLRTGVSGAAVLDTRNQTVARFLDHADSGFRDECDRRIRRRLVRVWARLHLHGKRSEWDRHPLARRCPSSIVISGYEPR